MLGGGAAYYKRPLSSGHGRSLSLALLLVLDLSCYCLKTGQHASLLHTSLFCTHNCRPCSLFSTIRLLFLNLELREELKIKIWEMRKSIFFNERKADAALSSKIFWSICVSESAVLKFLLSEKLKNMATDIL